MVEPGVIVKLGSVNAMSSLIVNGTLKVCGTRTNPVVFASCCDDKYGGDTDGTDESPIEKCWNSVFISGADAVADIKYALFRYGGGRSSPGQATSGSTTYVYAPVRVSAGGEAKLDGCTFTDGYWGGIALMGGRVTAQNCLFIGNGGCAVYPDGGEATILNSVIYGCAGAVGNQAASGSNGKVTFANCIVDTVTNWENPFVGELGYDHCCFHNRTDGETGCGWAGSDGNIELDPLFNDQANGDFRLVKGSTALDKGVKELWMADPDGQDFFGGRRVSNLIPDLGYHELQVGGFFLIVR